MDEKCPVFWGSHGCDLPVHTEGQHWCKSCCDPGDPEHMAAHAAATADQYGADGCAGTWPYYGERSMSGPDAPLAFFTVDWDQPVSFIYMPDEFAKLKTLPAVVPPNLSTD